MSPDGEVDWAAWKVPLPLPSSTLTLLLVMLAVARSGLPSPLKSPTATDIGSVPAAKLLARPEGAVAVAQQHAHVVAAECWRWRGRACRRR